MGDSGVSDIRLVRVLLRVALLEHDSTTLQGFGKCFEGLTEDQFFAHFTALSRAYFIFLPVSVGTG
jgi:hypothetical protein